ncbi:uncharacterized protein LOC125273069 isoform X1 [Megalobrama amblycephala]|uniref:uncharacterized protein LOC125273069 isoform X1 n=1 Tax=Megalobrama amblycephala TaxID=75352 RepID=UPI0020145BCF|nr:uncharacterized protein LOC125273069 isoform X1 [Megalobrama amblycephala]
MRNRSFIVWVFLLVDGVFGVDTGEVKTISVMEGDSVTLHPDVTQIQRDVTILWIFGHNNSVIARINRKDVFFRTFDGDDGRFRDRLELNEQTLSLTIRNIKTEHSGLYKLSEDVIFEMFSIIVQGNVESVSVKEGDSVTLHTDLTAVQNSQILWRFGDNNITDLNGNIYAGWTGIFYLNDQTGELTIRNVRTRQSGNYDVKIKNNNMLILHRTFHINLSGVFSDEKDGVKTVSKKTGTDVLLHTHVIEIEKDDPIEWTFGPQNISIAKTDGKSKNILYNYNDLRFKNRLYLQIDSGDLTISDANSEHSGLYQLKIMNNTYTIQKRFSVTVSDSGLSSGAIAGIGVLVVVIVAAAAAGVIYYCCKTPRSVL